MPRRSSTGLPLSLEQRRSKGAPPIFIAEKTISYAPRRKITGQASRQLDAIQRLIKNLIKRGFSEQAEEVRRAADTIYGGYAPAVSLSVSETSLVSDAQTNLEEPSVALRAALMRHVEIKTLRGDIRQQTALRQASKIKLHIGPALGDVPVGQVSTEQLQEFFDLTLPAKKKDDGTALLGSSQMRDMHGLLNNFFVAQVEAGKILTNPMTGIRRIARKPPQRELNINVLATTVSRLIRELSPSEFDYFLPSFLGLRQSERLGLQHDQVSLLETGGGVLAVDRQLVRDTVSSTRDLKTVSSRRDIPLTPWLADNFRRILLDSAQRQWVLFDDAEASPLHQSDDDEKPLFEIYSREPGRIWSVYKQMGASSLYLYTRPESLLPIRHQSDGHAWRALLKEQQIEGFRHHELRHLATSLLVAEGVHPTIVNQLLGHSSLALGSTSTYSHPSKEALIGAVGIWEEYIKAARKG